MRVFIGMILGAILTVLGAYLFDHLATGPATTASESESATAPRTMVNWDIVGRNWQSVKLQLNQGWTKLSSHIAR